MAWGGAGTSPGRVHGVERGADGEDADDDADHDRELLLPGRGSDEVAGLEVLEVSPALEAAMQTTPPMVMASAPKAGAVQPLTRKMAAVAMRVAMVMPETGRCDAADDADDARARQ